MFYFLLFYYRQMKIKIKMRKVFLVDPVFGLGHIRFIIAHVLEIWEKVVRLQAKAQVTQHR